MNLIAQNYQDMFDFDELMSTSVFVICGDKKWFTDDGGLVGGNETRSYDVGSGFTIFNDGNYSLIVTSGHVVEDAFNNPDSKVFLSFSEGDNSTKQEAFVQGFIRDDLALMVTKCGKRRCWLDISRRSILDVGMSVYMSSFAGGIRRNTCTSGQLASPKVKGTMLMGASQASSFVELCIGADAGSSGAAIVDDSMNLIAVMSCASLNDIHIAPEHALHLASFNLKAPGDFKYAIDADKLRLLVKMLTSTLPLNASIADRLAHIIETRVIPQSHRCCDE